MWLSTEADVEGCASYEDYAARLALNGGAGGPGFRFRIGSERIGTAPNVRPGGADHDPTDTMSLHEPTGVDGMHCASYVPGGRTAGGAREYVSRLDNTQALDWMEIVA